MEHIVKMIQESSTENLKIKYYNLKQLLVNYDLLWKASAALPRKRKKIMRKNLNFMYLGGLFLYPFIKRELNDRIDIHREA